jgi:hypothetical protein
VQLLVGADGPVQLLLADVAPGAHRVADSNNLELRHRAWVQPEDIHPGAELSGSVSLLLSCLLDLQMDRSLPGLRTSGALGGS